MITLKSIKNGICLMLAGLFILSCQKEDSVNRTLQARDDIREAEHQFAAMAKEKGVAEAFLHFAAEDAVLLRGDKLIKGKAAIKDYFEQSTLTDVRLEWDPDFVDAAASGELGYTWGRFTFSARTADGEIKSEGIFHTVWKKQADGQWKFVWD